MVTIQWITTKNQTGLDLRIRGHAGGKKGQDLVCAATSILAYTAAETARQLHRQGVVAQAPYLYLAPGWCQISVAEGKAHFAPLRTGFSLLAGQYPNQVKLEDYEVKA